MTSNCLVKVLSLLEENDLKTTFFLHPAAEIILGNVKECWFWIQWRLVSRCRPPLPHTTTATTVTQQHQQHIT